MRLFFILLLSLLGSEAAVASLTAQKVSGNLSRDFMNGKHWAGAKDQPVNLMAQPMVAPKPQKTETPVIQVAAIHDGKWIAFRLRWKDREPSSADRLATFSDAVALQFPVKNNEAPPPIIMGAKNDAVHIFHWRYQYQLDATGGKKTIDKIYPNMTTDMYALDFKNKGNFKQATQEQKEAFVGGTAAGNPQSFPKAAVDEILAEGFGTSAVQPSPAAKGFGKWKNGEWTVWIARPLAYREASQLPVGKKTHVAFAVWQGGKKEVGAIKCVTMAWVPLTILEK